MSEGEKDEEYKKYKTLDPYQKAAAHHLYDGMIYAFVALLVLSLVSSSGMYIFGLKHNMKPATFTIAHWINSFAMGVPSFVYALFNLKLTVKSSSEIVQTIEKTALPTPP